MEWEEWEPIYKKILQDFGYDEEKDKEASKLALKYAKKQIEANVLKKFIENRIVSICGAGKNLEKELKNIEGTIISADEATSILLKNNIVPHIITTDLDGNIEDLLEANKKGSILIIHVHGDNIQSLKHISLFKNFLLTTQSKPFDKLHNFGGFTDGDRAYCIAKHFNAKKIKLIGFNFEEPRKKEGKDLKIKKRKLEWAKKIIRNGNLY